MRAGLFDELLPMFIDLDMFIRVAYYFRFCHIEEPLVYYNSTPGSITSSGNHIAAVGIICRKYFHYIKKDRGLMNDYCLWLGGRMLCSRQSFNQGRKYLIKAFLAYPFNMGFFIRTIISLLGMRVYSMASCALARFRSGLNKLEAVNNI